MARLPQIAPDLAELRLNELLDLQQRVAIAMVERRQTERAGPSQVPESTKPAGNMDRSRPQAALARRSTAKARRHNQRFCNLISRSSRAVTRTPSISGDRITTGGAKHPECVR